MAMVNLPNMISFIRLLLVPVFLAVFWLTENGIAWGMFTLIIAGVTDVIDGHLARKLNMVTPLGKILDPAADKLMIISAMISLFLVGRFPLWLVTLLLIKEVILVSGSFFVVFQKKLHISANNFGKIATVAVYAALLTSAFNITGSSLFTLIAGMISVLALTNYILYFTRRRSG